LVIGNWNKTSNGSGVFSILINLILAKKQMNKPEIKKFLSEIIAIDTSNPPGNEGKAAYFLAVFLKDRARKIELVGKDKRKNIIAFFGNLESENILLFNGHLDTIPFNKNEWQTNPLELTEKNGRYYGRGAADMKGGITASIFAILEAEELGYLKNKQVIFAGSADEETGAGSEFGSKLIAEYLIKNKIKARGVLIPEPSGNKKYLKINLGHRGLVWIKARSFGEAGHAGLLRKENNSILKIQGFIQEMYGLFPKEPKKIKGIPQSSVRITFINSGNSEHYNIIPKICEANFDVRVSPYEDNSKIISKITKIADKLGIKISIIKNTSSSRISKNEKIVKVFENVLKLRKQKYKLGFASPACDAHWYVSAGIPTINGAGPIGENAHAPNEYILAESLYDRIDLFTELIREF